MLYKFGVVFVKFLTLHHAIGNLFGYPDIQHARNEYGSNILIKSEGDTLLERYNSNFDENDIDDDEYPSEQLERIVEETTELLKSDKEEEKKTLKIKPSHFKLYRPSKTIRLAMPRGKLLRLVDDDDRCPAIVKTLKPRKLTDIFGNEHWILNVKSLEQSIVSKMCINRGGTCIEESKMVFGYESQCEEVHRKVRLLAIPTDKELVKENQEFTEFSLPSECVCIMKRIE